MHGQRHMEIISDVLDGELAHRDSLGDGSVIRPGNVQRMSACRGARLSGFNHSTMRATHFLQSRIEPNVHGVTPSDEEKHFSDADERSRLCRVVSADGAYGSVTLHRDAHLYCGLFDRAESAALTLAPGRCAYVHVARGVLEVNGGQLAAASAGVSDTCVMWRTISSRREKVSREFL